MDPSEPYELDSSGAQGNFANVKWYGLAPVLSVQSLLPKVQSTVFYGNTLYMLDNDVGIFNRQTGFVKFMDQFLNRSVPWAELTQIPYWPGLRRLSAKPVAAQDPPVAMAPLIMLGAGYDPLKGYWLEFQGNFFLGFPLFQPADGTQYQVAFGGGPANPGSPGSSPLTASGFDVPVGGNGGKKS